MKAHVIRVFVVSVLSAGLCFAADADFAKWWPGFQSAVAKNDVRTVVRGIHYPLQWENGPIREIQTARDFVARYDTYFTPEIKHAIASLKPERLPSGTYIVTWKARGNEYSLYFKPDGSGGFALDGLSEGPP
jgi:hypothetical protein